MYFRVSVLCMAVTAITAAWGQPAAPLAFEVASVKLAEPAEGPRRAIRPGVDRLDFPNVSLWYCMSFAYGVKSYQLTGPDWLRELRFDITAKGPDGTRREQLPEMMRTLLAERFKLQVHHETREIAGLILTVGKSGPKLKEAAPESGDGQGGASVGMSATATGSERLDFKGAPMTTLANTLTALLGRPVVDKTGLTGRYDFVLEFTRSETAGPRATGGFNEPPRLPPPVPRAEPGLSIYSSIQQLGIKLDPQKLPMDVIVFDSAEKTPAGN